MSMVAGRGHRGAWRGIGSSWTGTSTVGELRITRGHVLDTRYYQLSDLTVASFPDLCAWDSNEFRELCRPR